MMKVVFFPQPYEENKYLSLLASSLSSLGVTCEKGPSVLDRSWLKNSRKSIEVLHFHWIQYQYLHESLLDTVKAFCKFTAKLVLARRMGFGIVWTVHNILPHEQQYPILDILGRIVMSRVAHCVIVHCEKARQVVEKKFLRRRNIFVIPHGNYIGAYQKSVGQSEARKRLGLGKESFVYLFFGLVRAYKGIEELLISFQELEQDNVSLVIAGKPDSSEIEEKIKKYASTDRRIRTHLDYVPDDEIQIFFEAADVVVLPYRDVLTSGAAMLALSFGKPVIAPALGCLPEMVPADAGILYDPGESEGLRRAMEEITHMDVRAMGQKALFFVEKQSWDMVAKQTARAYEAALKSV